MKAFPFVQLALALALAGLGRAQNYDPLAANVSAQLFRPGGVLR
jgi:hypothetical protein